MELTPFNPLDKRNLGVSIANAIFEQEIISLNSLQSFIGAGIYALYYKGNMGESLLIERTKPLWNIVIDGFGNHDPGSGRYNQQMSAWDTIHPGRNWARKLQKGKTKEEIVGLINNFYQ